MQGVEAGPGALAYLSLRKSMRAAGDGVAEVYH